MQLRDKILRDAIRKNDAKPEWVAERMIELYRSYLLEGREEEEAIQLAKREMERIAGHAIQIRKKRNDRKSDIVAWMVIVLGALACYGWWVLWS